MHFVEKINGIFLFRLDEIARIMMAHFALDLLYFRWMVDSVMDILSSTWIGLGQNFDLAVCPFKVQ